MAPLSLPVMIVLLVLVVISISLTLYTLMRLRRYQRAQQALMRLLQEEVQAMTGSSIGMGKRLLQLEQHLNTTMEKQTELALRDPGELAYQQAARLVEMGADVDDLVSSCGIGRPEAELMALLHKELAGQQRLEGR